MPLLSIQTFILIITSILVYTTIYRIEYVARALHVTADDDVRDVELPYVQQVIQKLCICDVIAQAPTTH